MGIGNTWIIDLEWGIKADIRQYDKTCQRG